MMEECLNGLSVQSEKYDNLEGLVLKGNFFLTRKVITVNFASHKLDAARLELFFVSLPCCRRKLAPMELQWL